MSTLLAADIGKRRTGLALADTKAGFIMALNTVSHKTDEELLQALSIVVQTKRIDELIIGLPLLPQGGEGEQSTYVRGIAEQCKTRFSIPIILMDERYTTPSKGTSDPDAAAACAMLSVVLDQRAQADKEMLTSK